MRSYLVRGCIDWCDARINRTLVFFITIINLFVRTILWQPRRKKNTHSVYCSARFPGNVCGRYKGQENLCCQSDESVNIWGDKINPDQIYTLNVKQRLMVSAVTSNETLSLWRAHVFRPKSDTNQWYPAAVLRVSCTYIVPVQPISNNTVLTLFFRYVLFTRDAGG